MNIDVRRLPDVGIAAGGHAFSAEDDDYFECPQQVAAIRMRFSFQVDEITEDAEGGMTVTMYLTRDEAHDFATGLVDCTCDG